MKCLSRVTGNCHARFLGGKGTEKSLTYPVILLTATIYLVVLKPIQKLTNAIQEVEQGHVGRTIEVTRDDEIGILAHRYNQMRDALKEKIESLNKEIDDHKTTENALRVSDERYREIVEGTDNLVTEVNSQGRITFVNEASRKIFGLPPQECIGRPAFDFIHPEDQEKTQRHFFQWIKEKQSSVTFENRQISIAGESRDMLWSINFHFDAQGGIASIKSIARDITDRKRAEENLRISNERFQRIFKSETIGIVLADLDGHFLEANDAFLAMTGFQRNDLPMDWFAITPPEWIEQDREIIRQIRERGIIPAFEKEYLRHDGSRLPVTIVGVQLKEEGDRILCFILDQTERKKAEAERMKSKATLASIFKAAPIGIGVVVDRVITYTNDCLCSMTGYAKEEMANKKAAFLYPSMEEFEHVGEKKYAQIQKFGSGTVETVWKRKDGARINILLSSTPINPDNLSDGVTFTAMDITKRKEAEQKLVQYRDHLEELVEERTIKLKQTNAQLQLEISERTRVENELRQFAETQKVLVREVNHRVKNNLTAIISMLHMEEDRAIAEGLTSYLPVMRDLVGRIEGLLTIHNLLSVSGWKPLEVYELCHKVANAALKGVPIGKQVSVDITPSDVRINSNQAHHLTLVINELATNTMKYALKNRRAARICISLNQKAQMLEILFKDDGPGFPEHIFADGFSPSSLGYELIQGITRRSLRGDVSFTNDAGALVAIQFPNEMEAEERRTAS